MSDDKKILWKDARILFNKEFVDEKRFITKVFVAEFKHDCPDHWPMWLYDEYDCDIGNSLSDWDEWTPVDVVKSMLFKSDFIDTHARLRTVDQLGKISEMKYFIEICELFNEGK